MNSRPSVKRLTGSLGAVVEGVRLGPDLTPDQVAFVRDALLKNRVIFVRDQTHLDDAQHRAFGELLGPPTAPNPLVDGSDPSQPKLVEIRGGGKTYTDIWHTDTTFVDRPPSMSVLRALEIPSVGGDTLWANTVAAYERMGPVLQDIVGKLWARHTSDFDYHPNVDSAFVTDHPVVRLHPETGEPSIMLGLHAKFILGLNSADSRLMMELIQRHIEQCENIVRWNWRIGDVAIWDNRSTQHYAISDYDEPRLLRRVTISGDVPVGLDGRRSMAIKGDASSYSPINSPPRCNA